MAVTPILVHPRPRLTLADIAAEPGGHRAIRRRITELHKQGFTAAATAVEIELREWEAAQRISTVRHLPAATGATRGHR